MERAGAGSQHSVALAAVNRARSAAAVSISASLGGTTVKAVADGEPSQPVAFSSALLLNPTLEFDENEVRIHVVLEDKDFGQPWDSGQTQVRFDVWGPEVTPATGFCSTASDGQFRGACMGSVVLPASWRNAGADIQVAVTAQIVREGQAPHVVGQAVLRPRPSPASSIDQDVLKTLTADLPAAGVKPGSTFEVVVRTGIKAPLATMTATLAVPASSLEIVRIVKSKVGNWKGDPRVFDNGRSAVVALIRDTTGSGAGEGEVVFTATIRVSRNAAAGPLAIGLQLVDADDTSGDKVVPLAPSVLVSRDGISTSGEAKVFVQHDVLFGMVVLTEHAELVNTALITGIAVTGRCGMLVAHGCVGSCVRSHVAAHGCI